LGDGEESEHIFHCGELFDQREKDEEYSRIAVDSIAVGEFTN